LLSVARFTRVCNAYRTPETINLDPGALVAEAVDLLFNEHEFSLNPWNRRIIDAWCNYDLVVLIGSAASGKSHTVGLLALLDWMISPKTTSTFLASTTRSALEKRSWNSILHFYGILRKKGMNGILSRTRTAVINEDDEKKDQSGYDVKSGLFGLAVLAGSLQDSVSNLVGVHQPDTYGGVRMIADEAQSIKQAFLDARNNLMIGSPDFKLVCLGNPMSYEDPLGRMAEPVGGWNSVSIEDDSWPTKSGGICVHFDGTRSPAVEDPKKYPYLINQFQIDGVLKANHGNEQSRDYLTMCRGWIAADSDFEVVLPSSEINKFECKAPAIWEGHYDVIAGFDPAFSTGGDDAVLQIAKVGFTTDAVLTVEFGPYHYLTLSDDALNPIVYQLAEQIQHYAAIYGFSPQLLAIDDSATQNVADTIEMEFGRGILRKSFGAKASEMPVSEYNSALCKDYYRNVVTELWYTTREFARYGQIRGLSNEAAKEFGMRRVLPKRPRQLESKSGTPGVPGMKQRLRRSPDHADACALCFAVARERLGCHPGATKLKPVGVLSSQFYPEFAQTMDIDGFSDNYMSTGF
jgi:hypothetical protein